MLYTRRCTSIVTDVVMKQETFFMAFSNHNVKMRKRVQSRIFGIITRQCKEEARLYKKFLQHSPNSPDIQRPYTRRLLRTLR